MVEEVRTRQRERETVPGSEYERALEEVSRFVERGKNGTITVRDSDRDWELCRQGVVKFYLVKDEYPETVLQDWFVFVHDIKKQSGKHRHQGGLVLFVIEGEGSTEVNGELIDWEEGDCILLPLHPDGIEHVHFNRGNGNARWLAFVYEPCFNHVASELSQSAVYSGFLEALGNA
jgi:mannose-6-phosphate isomerase-like protein (cupin superfamily)